MVWCLDWAIVGDYLCFVCIASVCFQIAKIPMGMAFGLDISMAQDWSTIVQRFAASREGCCVKRSL